MRRIFTTIALTVTMVLGSMMANAQPVHSFSVKIGIDHESVDSLGGRENVERLIRDMFRRIK